MIVVDHFQLIVIGCAELHIRIDERVVNIDGHTTQRRNGLFINMGEDASGAEAAIDVETEGVDFGGGGPVDVHGHLIRLAIKRSGLEIPQPHIRPRGRRGQTDQRDEHRHDRQYKMGDNRSTEIHKQ